MVQHRHFAATALLSGLALAACASDEVLFAGPELPASGGQGGTGASGGGTQPVGGGGAGAGADDRWFIVPNVDDDDTDGQADWSQAPFDRDNELLAFELPGELREALAPTDIVRLTLAGDGDDFRFWLAGSVVLGRGEGSERSDQVELGTADLTAPLWVEARTFERRATVTVERRNADSQLLVIGELSVHSAPLVLNHHLQAAERIWAVVTGSNQSMIDAIASASGPLFAPIHSYDPWIQDELEWATATRDGHRLDVAVDSIRDRELDTWVKALKAPDVQPMTWGLGAVATTEDKFGNLETTPPLTAGGVSYPFGRIYYGANDVVGPTAALTDFLAEQRLQAPIEVDTGWLCVGHVDEFMTFVPDAASAKGFKLLYADVPAAYALLESLSASTAIPRYGSAHGYPTVGAIVSDASLRALNEDVQADYLTPILAGLEAELGLEAADVIRVPALFERIVGCPYSNAAMEVGALIPALVNLTVLNPEEEAPIAFMPDPFLRPAAADQQSDPLIGVMSAALPAGVEVVFVDDWYSYHVLIGEVHCGTNVSRTPSPRWWVEGLGLLGGS